MHRDGTGTAAGALAILFTAAAVVVVEGRVASVWSLLCHEWPWHDLGLGRAGAALLPGFAVHAAGWLALLRLRGRRAIATALILFSLSCLLLQAGSVWHEPNGLGTVARRVESAMSTSYYTDALRVQGVGSFLREFHRTPLHLHSATHPPGPILFYRSWIGAAGAPSAAAAGGWTVAALAAGVVPLLYLLAGRWTSVPVERGAAAALWSVLPSIVVFVPEFDQLYAGFTVGLLVSWHAALEGGRRAPWLFGGLLAIALFFAWNLLALGLFFLISALLRGLGAPDRARFGLGLARVAGIALAANVVLYTALFVVSGYRPLAAFLSAHAAQQRLVDLGRICPPPYSFVNAPVDLALGLGAGVLVLWIAAVLATLRRTPDGAERLWTLTGAATLVTLLVAGWMPQELARVWIFVLPLVVVPAGLTLARLRPSLRYSFLVLHGLFLAALVANMRFVDV